MAISNATAITTHAITLGPELPTLGGAPIGVRASGLVPSPTTYVVFSTASAPPNAVSESTNFGSG